MRSRTERWYDLDEDDSLHVCKMSDSVRLSHTSSDEEFSINLRPCHLPVLRELVLELEALQDLQRIREAVPV